MSDEPEKLLADLARAIAAGAAVDWASAESAAADEATRQVVHAMAVIAAIADVHRAAPVAASAGESAGSETTPTWGTFRLQERIGGGAYGEVFRAWDARLDREVALKLLPVTPTDGPGSDATILHEGRLLARVRHPNVVTIHGAERIGDRIGLWMEFVRGRTLEQLLHERTRFAEAEVVAVGLELSRAVSAVHRAGLIHRDIKAQNVMRSDDGRIVLLDFGTGRRLDDETSADLAGTPLYLAPEVLQGQPATVRSDVYSLGVLLFYLSTGSYPVRARTVREIREAHERNERQAVQAGLGTLSPDLARVIARAIQPRPEERHEDADALAADLAALEASDRRSPDSPPSRSRVDASDLYERGRTLVARRGIPNVQKAAELFERAIRLNARFAPAHAALAQTYAFLSFPYRGIPFETAYPRMRSAARTALELDRTLADAHAAMGWVFAYEREWAAAEEAFDRAIHLEPSLTQSYTSYSVSTLQPLRKFDDALRLLRTAAGYDPQSLDVRREIGEVQLFSGRYAEAIETLHAIGEVEPDFPFVEAYLAKALIFAGRAEEAIPRLEVEQGSPWLARAYVATGRCAEAEKLAAESAAYPYRLAVIAAALGDANRAIDALERAASSEPHRIGRLLIEPELAWLLEYPRVRAVRRAFHLP
jgi:serine/threonine protein kinase